MTSDQTREITARVNLTEQMPAPAEPYAVARVLLGEWQRQGFLLVHHGGELWTWTGPHWTPTDPTDITARIYNRLEDAKYIHYSEKKGPELRNWNPSKPKVAQVFDGLVNLAHVPGQVDPPAWVGKGLAPWSGPVVACRNGLLELGTRHLHSHNSWWFNQTSVPFDYDPDAEPPARWLAFLESLWPDDPEATAALQEWLGYIVSGRGELHKILLLVGPPRSGKGTIGRVLELLVGEGNTTSPTLAQLGTNFGPAQLIGKPLALVGDARLSGRADTSPVVERLLSISGGDVQTIDRKYRDTWTGHLPTRFVILSNELPRLGDASAAIASRFLTLTLERSWRGREDVTLGRALEAELPGILNWSLDGLDRLLARGAFVEPQSSLDAMQALYELSSPTAAFLAECCEPGGEVPVREAYARWQQWAMTNGHPPGSVGTFARNLRAVVPGLRTANRGTDPHRVRTLVGLHLTPYVPSAPMPGVWSS